MSAGGSNSLPAMGAHHALRNAIMGVLKDPARLDIYKKLLREPSTVPVLDYTGSGRQTPLYSAVYELVTRSQVTPKNAADVAKRLYSVLLEMEKTVGLEGLDQAANAICYSHPLKDGKRYHTETLRDLLEDEPKTASHFAGVIQRFHLLSRRDVVRENIPFIDRMDGEDSHPFRPFS